MIGIAEAWPLIAVMMVTLLFVIFALSGGRKKREAKKPGSRPKSVVVPRGKVKKVRGGYHISLD